MVVASVHADSMKYGQVPKLRVLRPMAIHLCVTRDSEGKERD